METIVLPRVEQARNLARVVAFLSALPTKKAWRVRIDELKGDRTEHQNNALFGVAYPPLTAATGYRAEELHELMCCKFFGVKVIQIGELSVEKPLRTTTTDEHGKRDVIDWERFGEFFAMVQQVGSEVGVWIPDPNRNLRTR
jgi:hypothetical protein